MLKTIRATVTGPYNGLRKKTDSLLKTGDMVEILLETGHEISENLSPPKEAVCVLYEDNDVIVLDKPAGISVHLARGQYPAPWGASDSMPCCLRRGY